MTQEGRENKQAGPGYTVPVAAKIARVPYTSVNYWARSGFIVPSVRGSGGQGVYRRYSFVDVVSLRVAGELRRGGVSLQGLRRVVRYLRRKHGLDHPLSEAVLVTDGHDVFKVVAGGDAALSVLREPGQSAMVHVLDLGRVWSEVRAEVDQLDAAERKVG